MVWVGVPHQLPVDYLVEEQLQPFLEMKLNYVTIASLGNSQSFGDLTAGVRYPSATSSPTRGIFGGGKIHLQRIIQINYM